MNSKSIPDLILEFKSEAKQKRVEEYLGIKLKLTLTLNAIECGLEEYMMRQDEGG